MPRPDLDGQRVPPGSGIQRLPGMVWAARKRLQMREAPSGGGRRRTSWYVEDRRREGRQSRWALNSPPMRSKEILGMLLFAQNLLDVS